MKISIKEGSGKSINIKIPSGTVLNGLTAGIIAGKCQKRGTDISKEQMRVLIKAIKEYKKYHDGWKFVEIDGADGGCVEIDI